jgi:hypothetical protein
VIEEAQCIWLRVPFRDRMLVREIWAKPVDEGGLSNDEGEEMMTVFLLQNYEEIERFFAKRLRKVGRTVRDERERIHPEIKAARIDREREEKEAAEREAAEVASRRSKP